MEKGYPPTPLTVGSLPKTEMVGNPILMVSLTVKFAF